MIRAEHGNQGPAGRAKTLLSWAVLLGGLSMGAAQAAADQPPPELKMILSPGWSNSEVITFSAEGEDRQQEKEAAPMTVLPPETMAESAAERAELVSGRSRNRYSSYQPSLDVGVGYRRDNLDWNIAGFGGSPNIRSELTFDGMECIELSGNFHWRSESNLYLRGGMDFGSTLDGDVQDSDFNGNNRRLEYSRSYSDSDGGSVLDASVGIGYLFEVPLRRNDWAFRIAPLAGYSYHRQNIEINDGWQLSYDEDNGVIAGSLAGLDSSYEAEWTGPWIGLDLELALNNRQSLQASLEYHWVDYEADANWNLRDDLLHPVSYEHESDGEGFVASLVYKQQLASQWFWTIGAKYSNFKADSGKNLMYFSDGYWLGTRLNEVNWESYAVMAGVGFKF